MARRISATTAHATVPKSQMRALRVMPSSLEAEPKPMSM
jgi:hypothetical protein